MKIASSFPLVECVAVNNKMLFHYYWFLSTYLAFLTSHTQKKPPGAQLLLFPFYLCIILLRKQKNAADI